MCVKHFLLCVKYFPTIPKYLIVRHQVLDQGGLALILEFVDGIVIAENVAEIEKIRFYAKIN